MILSCLDSHPRSTVSPSSDTRLAQFCHHPDALLFFHAASLPARPSASARLTLYSTSVTARRATSRTLTDLSQTKISFLRSEDWDTAQHAPITCRPSSLKPTYFVAAWSFAIRHHKAVTRSSPEQMTIESSPSPRSQPNTLLGEEGQLAGGSKGRSL